ncbi:hypothetical protein NB851_028895, partial [Pseudomonas aeruginosa]|nr:hypothetical protein [Pseudomonas aeruginosa]
MHKRTYLNACLVLALAAGASQALAAPGASEMAGEVGGQAVLGRQQCRATPWLTERHGYDPTLKSKWTLKLDRQIGSSGKHGIWAFHCSESTFA